MLLCSLNLLLSGPAQSQNKALDSLIHQMNALNKLAPTFGRDTSLLLSLSLLTERAINVSDSRAVFFLDSLQSFSEKINWIKGKGLYKRALGKREDVKGNYKNALGHYNKAIELLEKAGGDPYELTYAYVLTAFVLSNNGLTESCLKYLTKALPLAKKTKNSNNLGWILDFYGDYHYYSKFKNINYKKALYYYLEVSKILPNATSTKLKADNLHCLANVYLRLGDVKKADEFRNKAIKYCEATNDNMVLFAINSDIAEIYEEQKMYQKAIQYRKLSLDFAQKSGWKEMSARSQNQLYRCYKMAGDYKNALSVHEAYMDTEDSLGRVDLRKKNAELEAQFENTKQRTQITDLTNANLLKTRNFLLAISLLGMILTFYIFWSNRQLKLKNRELLLKNNEIESALYKGQSIERKRVASDLHDTLNTKIAALRWQLEAIEITKHPLSEQKIITHALQMISDIYDDVRLISHNLLPTDLENLGLTEALKTLISNLNSNSKTAFNLVLESQLGRVSTAIEFQVYSIILELINNILKHAKATKAWISASKIDSKLVLSVQDNGVGINESSKKDGVGLLNLQSRIQNLGGEFKLISTPTTGTKIEMTIPV